MTSTTLPGALRSLARRCVPLRIRRSLGLAALRATRWPPVGSVDLGDLGRTTPISRSWGFDRGTPIDRYYIERFLERHASDVRGRVLEVLNDAYTVRYGGDRVLHSDVLHHVPGNPRATVVADLTDPDSLPPDAYDCVICTQTLQFIYDVPCAIRTLHRILAPGGTLLVTVPGIAQISRADMDTSGEYWRFTGASVRALFEQAFGRDIDSGAHGNVASAVAFLHGIASEELDADQLDTVDPDYEVILTLRVVKGRGRP